MNIEWLIDPISMDQFLEEYWGKNPIHVQRKQPDYFSSLFSLADLDELLGFSFNNQNVRMAWQNEKKSQVIRDGPNKTSICNFYDYYYQGQTVVVQNVHLRWEPIARIANALSQQIGLPIGTHLYATPEDNQGFGIHWDDHDIFALQLAGAKEWCLYEGPESPRKSSSKSEFIKQLIENPGPPTHEVVLKAGDLLYFPRGVTHRVIARTEPSLHLTFGVYSVTWEDVLKKSFDLYGSDILDQPLAPGALNEEGAYKQLGTHLNSLYSNISDEADFGHVRSHLAAKIIRNMPVLPDGHFGQLGQLGTNCRRHAFEEKRRDVGARTRFRFRAEFSFFRSFSGCA